MRKLLFGLLLLCGTSLSAQINITPYLPDELEIMYPDAAKVLESKLNNILSANDISTDMGQSRFVLTGNWTNETKDVVSGAPLQIAYTLNINLYIGDGATGTKYVSETFRVKGVGATEEKAHLAAIRNLQAQSSKMSDFVCNGKDRIINYYEDNKEKILAGIRSLTAKYDYEEAVYQLCLVPMECSYYDEVQEMVSSLYPRIIDSQAAAQLTEAKAVWAADQTENGANQVISLVSQINPNASCYPEVQDFVNTVTAKINQINEREYAIYKQNLKHQQEMEKLELQKSENLQSQRIAAARDIAVAYAKHQRPVVVYRVRNWF